MEHEAIVNRVRNEFVEVPGLRLTMAQAMKLWGLGPDECQQVISMLVASSFLRLNARGQILREG